MLIRRAAEQAAELAGSIRALFGFPGGTFHASMEDDTAHAPTRAYWENLGAMMEANARMRSIDPEDPFGGMNAPLHPGARFRGSGALAAASPMRLVSWPDPLHPSGRYRDMYEPDDFPMPQAFTRNDWTPPPFLGAR